jgi:hypothetical protein
LPESAISRLAADQGEIILGTANQVAIAPPLALRQSKQLQSAMKVGSVLNSNLTAPCAAGGGFLCHGQFSSLGC